MTTQFDLTQPVRTRDGRPARIICTDVQGDYPILALVTLAAGTEFPQTYLAGGHVAPAPHRHCHDLINIPPEPRRLEVTVYLYVDEWDNTLFAQVGAPDEGRIGSARVTLVEGEWAEEMQP